MIIVEMNGDENQYKELIVNSAGKTESTSTQMEQWSSEPSMVVVRRYSNTPYIPREMSHSLCLDVDTLSVGTTSTKFPWDHYMSIICPMESACVGYTP